MHVYPVEGKKFGGDAMNRDQIRRIKQATVAIGLVDSSGNMISINGSGFIVDEKFGIILTAKHVLQGMKMSYQFIKRARKMETYGAVFRAIHSPTEMNLDTAKIGKYEIIKELQSSKHFPLINMDLAAVKLEEKFPDFHSLSVKEPSSFKVLDEVAMCGYPGGEHSLDVQGKYIGVRYSPVFQIGRIGGILPMDDAEKPYGIQTDIIGVGGSSGSPLLDPNDGNVIGIAQKVIPASVEVDVTNYDDVNLKGFGGATIGQTYGITNHILHPMVNGIRDHFESGKDIDAKIDLTGLHFNYVNKKTRPLEEKIE